MKQLNVFVCLLLSSSAAFAQGTPADYERANGLRAKYEAAAINVPGNATWADNSTSFSYRRSVKGGHDFVVYDTASKQKRPAFNHERLAEALSKSTGNKYTALTLPFNTFTFVDN